MESLLAGRYRLHDRIGIGGMATVWLARDEVLCRPVAVKLIVPGLARDPEFRRRFRGEACAAARLSHPNIVTVHDYGESGGRPYIVMELLTGSTLAEVTDVPDVESVVAQIASALAAAHAAGIVHRDIKPNNVFLTGAGVKVLDFGIAGEARMGTPAYLPPERELSPAGDVYALGVTWFEIARGRRPKPGETLGGLQERCVDRYASARPSAEEIAAALGRTPRTGLASLDARPDSATRRTGLPVTRLLSAPGGGDREHPGEPDDRHDAERPDLTSRTGGTDGANGRSPASASRSSPRPWPSPSWSGRATRRRRRRPRSHMPSHPPRLRTSPLRPTARRPASPHPTRPRTRWTTRWRPGPHALGGRDGRGDIVPGPAGEGAERDTRRARADAPRGR